MTSTPGHSTSLVQRLTMTGLLACVLLLCGGDAIAQNAVASTPVSAGECTVAPRPIEELVAMLKAPPGLMRSGMMGTPITTPAPPAGGSPADAQTVTLVTETAREVFACLNAHDFPRLFALYSDHYLLGVWGGVDGPDLSEDDILARIEAISTPVPQPAGMGIALVAVENARVLPDGRVMAIVINDQGSSDVIFVKVGDRYLVDWAYPLSGASTPVPS